MLPTSSYVSEDLRRLVAIRAEYLCEYCLIHEDDTFYSSRRLGSAGYRLCVKAPACRREMTADGQD